MKNRPDFGVIIFLMWRDKFLLILRDNFQHIKDPNKWCPVTGDLEQGESYLHAIKRELREEIGVIPQTIIPIGTTRKHNAVFCGRLSDQEYFKVELGDEGQAIGFFSYKQLPTLGLAVAFTDHLGNAPEVFRKMSEEGYIPNQKDLFLQNYNERPPF